VVFFSYHCEEQTDEAISVTSVTNRGYEEIAAPHFARLSMTTVQEREPVRVKAALR